MKLTAETLIKSDRDTVMRLSQTPQLHARWDLRFTEIEYLPRESAAAPQRFRYTTRIGFGLAVKGWGETIGDPERATSALRFGSTDTKSIIQEGAGSWTYSDQAGTVRFSTVYDYTTRHGWFGRVLDLQFRPLMIWATRWSFDRLRIWIENGVQPEMSFWLWLLKVVARYALALTWIYEGLIPKILIQRADEIALVQHSGLYWRTPGHTLAALGFAEIAFGLWLLLGRFEKLAAILSTIGIISLATLVISVRPAVLADPLGGISKNLGLLACGLIVWRLSDLSPLASRAKPRRRREARDEVRSPFAAALREDLHRAASLVHAHLAPELGVHRYQGTMKSVWRIEGLRRWLSAPFLWVGSWMHTLFPETGEGIPFEIMNRFFIGTDGIARMTFERKFHFPGVERRFEATMRYDEKADVILDALGHRRHLLVELVPTIEDGTITLRSCRQWLMPFGAPIRIPLPRFLTGEATIQEWQESETSLGIRVTISNRMFGAFFGYEGAFERIDGIAENVRPVVAASTADRSLSGAARVVLVLVALIGTAAYGASFVVGTISNAAWGWSARVALAAGLSWPVFGLVLLGARRVGGVWEWFDICLRTMALGIAVLSSASAANLAVAATVLSRGSTTFVALHLAFLLAADVSMAVYFTRKALRLGMPLSIAVVLWVGVLNGAFALLLVLP
jgi:hypothetical protein